MPEHHPTNHMKDVLLPQIKSRFEEIGISDLPKNYRVPFFNALSSNRNYLGFSDEAISTTANLYRLFLQESRSMQDNSSNNKLLAAASLLAGKTGELPLWRFVCLPHNSFTTQDGTFSGWHIELGKRVYDTLTPALQRDKEMTEAISGLGLQTRLYFVLDDLEAPLTRIQLKPPQTSFFSLSSQEQQQGLQQLTTVKQITADWIANTVGGQFPFGVRFISDMMALVNLLI